MKKLLILLLCLFVGDSFASGIASNTNSAPCTNTTLETYSGNSNLAADWQPNEIQLRWYNENEKLTVQQSAQSCTYDGTLTVPQTPPTRTGYTFAGWEVRMPGTYTELEYIQTQNAQYIRTGVYQNKSLKSIETYAGFEYSTLPNRRELMGFSGMYNNYWGVISDGNQVFFNITPAIEGTYSISANTKYDIYTKQIPGHHYFKAYLNGVQVENLHAGSGFDNSELYILSLSGSYKLTNARMYYYRVLFDGETVFNGIPARRNSDGVVGMWDTVTQTFFTNAGTGTFTAGPVVQ